MTENDHATTEDTNRTITTVDHTHPDTDRPFGERVAFERGPTVAADGGDAGATSADGGDPGAGTTEAVSADGGDPGAAETGDTGTDDSESSVASNGGRMRDVDHTPPANAEPNRVFERGREGRDGDR